MTPDSPVHVPHGARHVVLVGMMGTGKSSVGRRIAVDGVRFVDTDTLVEERAGRSVRDIFGTDGEPAFRVMEEEAVAGCLADADRSVIATGGGAVESAATRGLLNRARADGAAYVVWLRAQPAELVSRVGRSPNRPLLEGDAEGRLRELCRVREGNYAAVADLVLDTDGMSVQQVAEKVRAAIGGAGQDGRDGRAGTHG